MLVNMKALTANMISWITGRLFKVPTGAWIYCAMIGVNSDSRLLKGMVTKK